MNYIMAELRLFKCKNCGWSIEAPNDGADMMMDSILAYYVCNDCKKVFEKSYALGTISDEIENCPECGGRRTKEWKPDDRCPKCGGDLEDKGLSCLVD